MHSESFVMHDASCMVHLVPVRGQIGIHLGNLFGINGINLTSPWGSSVACFAGSCVGATLVTFGGLIGGKVAAPSSLLDPQV